MRTLVFSKFFKSAVKVARCSGVAAYKRGIEIDFYPLHAFFDWPDGVTFDGCDLKVDSPVLIVKRPYAVPSTTFCMFARDWMMNPLLLRSWIRLSSHVR